MTFRPAHRDAETLQRDAPERRNVLAELDGFDAFFRAHYRSLVGLGYVLTGDRNVAEDLSQEALAKLHHHWERISHYDEPLAWTRRVLANAATSRGRRIVTEAKLGRRLRNRRLPDLEMPDVDRALWDRVRRLPARQAQSIALHYWNDLTLKEIAAMLEIGEESVKTHLSRGRATLRAQLGEERS